ncbi:MAG: YhcH/YjgK/YiaL family protein [Synergistaceae bacterium]|nr:YhcH/YjgK/YiaL family protein [Synergistaceae bacterium]MBR0184592.1 YhcH/YjgK/YiaL family protein [Synergistaceae bacterium]
MLSCNVKLAGKYSYLAPKFMAGLKWLSETDIASLPDGKHPLPDSDLVADIQTYTSKPAKECRFESHHEHFDIQYVAEGREYFGVCPVNGLKVTEAHPERDTYFYDEPETSGCVLLNQGDFIIVIPEEAHMPKCAVKDPEKVRKVVIKVKA